MSLRMRSLLWQHRFLSPSLYRNRAAPIIVGATGGSGTRVFHAILQQAGLFMGTRLNHAGDAMDLEPFLDRQINPLLMAAGRIGFDPAQLPSGLRRTALNDLADGLKTYSQDRPNTGLWGWKNPRSMYVLPLIHQFFPTLKFIHVVRDGRDMAFSDNQNQRNKHFQALFGHEPIMTNNADDEYWGAVASARLWATANAQIADWGEHHLGNHYYRIRLEDLCDKPTMAIEKLLSWMELPVTAAPSLAALVQPPESLGRWCEHPASWVAAVTAPASHSLERFGYEEKIENKTNQSELMTQ